MFEVRQDLTPEDFIRKEIDHLFILNQALTGTSVQKAESEGEITDIEELAILAIKRTSRSECAVGPNLTR